MTNYGFESAFLLSGKLLALRGYLAGSFTSELWQPIVILECRNCCRWSRQRTKAPRTASVYDTPLSAVSYWVRGTIYPDGLHANGASGWAHLA
ncbi:hypothetical protein MRX96_024303 [Rhipicephalus microplus]